MAQKTREVYRGKSDFPVFEYVEKLMPQTLIEVYQELPRHIRYTILSTIASVTLLWAMLSIVLGGINNHLATRGAFLYDALYTTYALETRALPLIAETATGFTVLPQSIATDYLRQMPLNEAAIAADALAQRDTFRLQAAPAQISLEALQSFLNELIAANTSTDASETAALTSLHQQLTAVNAALVEVSAINNTLATEVSIDPVAGSLPKLRETIAAVAATGIVMPELQALGTYLDTMTSTAPALLYRINECLASSGSETDMGDTRPCPLSLGASMVERADYMRGDSVFNVVAAEFASHEESTSVVSSLYQYGRSIGRTGNFSLGTIEYDYFFHFADDLYSFSWSHENWVYSISSASFADLDELLKVFPY